MRDDLSRLHDILRAIDRIQQECGVSPSEFAADAKLQVWALYHLQLIGEAARTLSAEFREQSADPVWSKAVGLRNILVHHYFDIDHELIWQVLEKDLPPFRKIVLAAIRRVEKTPGGAC